MKEWIVEENPTCEINGCGEKATALLWTEIGYLAVCSVRRGDCIPF